MPKKIIGVIPAYNEEKSITQVINEVKPYVDELIVINDGSTDETAIIVQKQNVIILSHIINRGQGASLQTGTDLALNRSADIIIHYDADAQFSANEIPDLVKPIQEDECDIVLGSRFLSKKSKLPKTKKIFILPLARLFNKIFYNLNFTDPQCGFRVLSRKAAAQINIEQDGMAHCNEILIKIKKYNLRFKEVPVTVYYHEFGQNFAGSFKIIKDLIIGKLIN